MGKTAEKIGMKSTNKRAGKLVDLIGSKSVKALTVQSEVNGISNE